MGALKAHAAQQRCVVTPSPASVWQRLACLHFAAPLRRQGITMVTPSGTRKPVQLSPAPPFQALQSPGDDEDDAIPGLLSDAASSNASSDDERDMPPLRGQGRSAAAASKPGSAFATGVTGLGGWVVSITVGVHG